MLKIKIGMFKEQLGCSKPMKSSDYKMSIVFLWNYCLIRKLLP